MEKKKILHIVPNSTYSNFITKTFEDTFNGNNIYIYIYIFKKRSIHFNENPSIQKVPFISKRFFNIIRNINRFECIAFHYLDTINALIAFISKEKTKLAWFMWGSDFYDNIPHHHFSTVSKKTKSIIRQGSRKKWITRFILFPVLSRLYNPIRSSMKLMDFFCTTCDEDYLLAKKYLDKSCKFVPFNYNIVSHREIQVKQDFFQRNILLGNNASPSNNHIDIIELLQQINLGNSKIIIPLSYGNFKYSNQLIKIIPASIKEKIYHIIDFLPKEEYFKIIRTCSFAIFNYNRQEGLGNIVELLANGCKIFINKNTTLWDYFNKLGIILYSIEDLRKDECTSLLSPLSETDARHNYQIIINEYGEDNVKTKTLNCISVLYS